MLSFVQPGWLMLLLCSILLFLVGCAVIPSTQTPSSPTRYPSMTLVLIPFATASPQTENTRPAMSMTPNILSEDISHRYTSTAPPPEDRAYAEAPTCFAGANGGYNCLGRVWNMGERIIGGAEIQVQVYDYNHSLLAENRINLEQRIIPSNTFAPYRVQFAPLVGEKAYIQATIIQQFPTLSTLTTIAIADAQGQVLGSGRYQLTATIENDLMETVHHIRFVATLMTSQREVVGYRVYEVDGTLQPAERRAIRFEMIPQIVADNLWHVLHVEGEIGE